MIKKLQTSNGFLQNGENAKKKENEQSKGWNLNFVDKIVEVIPTLLTRRMSDRTHAVVGDDQGFHGIDHARARDTPCIVVHSCYLFLSRCLLHHRDARLHRCRCSSRLFILANHRRGVGSRRLGFRVDNRIVLEIGLQPIDHVREETNAVQRWLHRHLIRIAEVVVVIVQTGFFLVIVVVQVVRGVLLLMDLVVIAQTNGRRDVLLANGTDSRGQFHLQRRAASVERQQIVLGAIDYDAVELNALKEIAVEGRDGIGQCRGRVDVGHFDTA